MFGFKPREPGDTMLTNIVQIERPVLRNLRSARKIVFKQIERDEQKQKERHDLRRKAARISTEGDLVTVDMQTKADGSSRKVSTSYDGPF